MSQRHKQLKRIRYRQSNEAWQKWAGPAIGFEPMGWKGSCDFCDGMKPCNFQSWATFCRGMDFTEMNEAVCSNCLPIFFHVKMDEIKWYNSRKYYRLLRQMERDMRFGF